MKFTANILTSISLSMLFTTSVFAASVAQVKESKILLNLEGSSMTTGEEFYLVNESGKKVGLAKIKAIKGEKALADLLKGKAAPGMSIQAKAAPASPSTETTSESSATSETTSEPTSEDGSPLTSSNKKESSQMETTTKKSSSSYSKKKKNIGGFLLGYALNNMSLTAQYGSTKNDLTMKDNGFLVKGFYDYSLTKKLFIRFGTGIQMFSVKGETTANICENGSTKSCEVSFTYVVGEANANYYLTDGSFKLWAGLGYSFLLAAAKKNSIPNLSSDASTNQMITVGVGADWWTSKSAFIPFAIQYGLFPGSSNVKADAMIISGGYGFMF